MLFRSDPSVALQGSAGIVYNNNGTHTVTYVAPPANLLDVTKPDLLTVRHTAQSGARGYSTSERLAISTILFGGIQITTVPTCLDPGDTLQFDAYLPGVPTPNLNWSASAGSIDANGLFTAPAQPQTVTITVEYANDPTLTDSIQVNVGGCSCQATVQIAGQDLGATRSVRFTLNSDSSAVTNIDWSGGVVGPQASSANLTSFGGTGGTIPLDVTGSWDADLAGLALGSGYYNPDIFNDSIPDRVTLDILENDGGNTLAGSASGQVYEVGTGIRAWSMIFRVEADPTYSTSTIRECRIG